MLPKNHFCLKLEMCKPEKHTKLCTCAADEVDEQRCWRLYRVDPDPRDFMKG